MKCTYCQGTKFKNGPCGGGTETFICANPDCRHQFYIGASCTLEDSHDQAPKEGWIGKMMNEMTHHHKLFEAIQKVPRDNKSAYVLIGTDGTALTITKKQFKKIKEIL